jgi:hypothetical protein
MAIAIVRLDYTCYVEQIEAIENIFPDNRIATLNLALADDLASTN